MTNLKPSMRLKVKGDTHFLPDPEGGGYFRNHSVSFQMIGAGIDKWIEKLMPMFNGNYSLAELTTGLPDPYRKRLFEIAEVLLQNGFVRDVSGDRHHSLPDKILEKYRSQIEFLENFGDSGAYRFWSYRQAKVLAIGAGPFFVSLVAALLESGLPKFHLWVTGSMPTNRERLMALIEHARLSDDEVDVKEVTLKNEAMNSWSEAIKPYDCILYVSQEGNGEELWALHTACKEEKKTLLPAMIMHQAGIAGPLVHPDMAGSLESAYRRIHRCAISKDPGLHAFSLAAGAMLANVVVFEWFKLHTEVHESESKSKVFLLDLETLEGNWHPFLPHPLVTGQAQAVWVEDFNSRLERNSDRDDPAHLVSYFSRLTSAETGVFHKWGEEELKQLPLAQCRVQPVNPLTPGPAELLPAIVRSGLTHHEARREAGLAGIESYVSEMAGLLISASSHSMDSEVGVDLSDFLGIGAGESLEEGVCRGLQKWLDHELAKRSAERKPVIKPVKLSRIDDNRCRFYLQALSALQGEPVIGEGEEVTGFPVIWVGAGGNWYSCAGLNRTAALRKALQHALTELQNQEKFRITIASQTPPKLAEGMEPLLLDIPEHEEIPDTEALRFALENLAQHRKRLLTVDLSVESFLREQLSGVYGVLVREMRTR